MDKYFNILLAEDDADDIALFREAIKGIKIGAEYASNLVNIIIVHNGVQAIDYLLKRGWYSKHREAEPDIVVLDINMPIKSGFEVLAELKAKNLKVLSYVLTTSNDSEHKQRAMALGAADYFRKPGKMEELREVIRKMLLISD